MADREVWNPLLFPYRQVRTMLDFDTNYTMATSSYHTTRSASNIFQTRFTFSGRMFGFNCQKDFPMDFTARRFVRVQLLDERGRIVPGYYVKITVTTTEKSVPVARMIVCLCNTKDSPDLQRFESDVLYDASVLLIGALGVTKMIVGNVRHIAFHNYMFPLTILDWMEMSNGTRCKPWYQNFPVVEAVTEEGALIVPDSVPEFGYNNYSTIVGGSNELSHVKGVLFTDSAMRFFTKKEWHYNKADVEGRTLIQYLELVMTMHPTAFCNCYSIVDTVLCVESTLKSTNFELVLRNDPVDDGGLLY